MMKYIFYLASGSSLRFGENKLLKKIGDKELFRYGFDTLKSLCEEDSSLRLCVVSRYEEILDFVKAQHVKTVYCPESVNGLSYTVKAAVNSFERFEEEDYLLFVVADQPLMKKESVKKLLEKAEKNVITARLAFGQRKGNPVLFSAKLVPEILKIEGDRGCGQLCNKYDCDYVQVSDERELEDVDTFEAFEKTVREVNYE